MPETQKPKLNVGSLVDLALLSGLLLLAYYLYARTSLWHTETLPYFLLYDSFIFPILGMVAAGAWGVRIYRRQLFGEHISWWYQFGKRELDILISICILIVFSPLLIIVAIAIKLESRGPILFKQIRVGKGLNHFVIYKFRTMYQEACEAPPETAHTTDQVGSDAFKYDPRVTPIGRILRRYSIDEFPQLINVIKGNMSWVGPRPHIPEEVAKYEPWQLRKYDILPGITGLAQVTGRKDFSFGEMGNQDLHYVEHVNLFLDLKIMLLTLPAILAGRGAY